MKIAISHDPAGPHFTLTTQVSPRHTRVFDLEDHDPLLKRYDNLARDWFELQGELAQMYHTA